jgi:hypothetical protein
MPRQTKVVGSGAGMFMARRWGAVVFGLPFVVAGIFIGLVAGGYVEAKKNAPDWVIAAAALTFFTVGLSLVVHGLRGIARRIRADRLAAANPGVPCLADHPWDMKGAVHNEAIGGSIFGVLVMVLFMAPFNWWAFISGVGPLGAKVVVVIFDLLVLAVVWNLFYLLLRRWKYGVTRLAFQRFPFVLGGTLDVVLHSSQVGGEGRATIVLRCIEERVEVQQRYHRRQRQGVAVEVWSDRQEIDLRTISQREWGLLMISFALPEGDLSTRLRDFPCRRWELEIKAEVRGIDFGATFLVPVYSAATPPV